MRQPKKQRAAYAIDWLQVLCRADFAYNDEVTFPDSFTSPQADASGNHRFYEFIEPKEFTRGYEQHRSVVWRGLVVAHVSAKPRSEYREPHSCTIKIANATLYCGDWYYILQDICQVLFWHPIRITRCDLCCDFNYFIGGLDPGTFIRKYVCKQKASYVRVGSNDFAVYGNKSNVTTIFNSIRWGSRQNGVSVYMYNKSKELREKKYKPWIVNHWKNHCLSSTKDVWRVEISINSDGCGLRELTSNVLHTLFIEDIATPDMARRMFQTYAAKYFRFCYTNQSIKHKKDLKEVQLINLDEVLDLKPCTITTSHDSGRRELMVLRSLQDMQDALQLSDSPFNCRENHQAISQLQSLYEEMFSRKSQEFRRTETARELMLKRLQNMLNERLQTSIRLQTAIGMNAREDVIKSMADTVERELTSLLPSPSEDSLACISSPPPRAAARNG